MNRVFPVLTAALLLSSGAAFAQTAHHHAASHAAATADSSEPAPATQDFVNDAATGGMFEVAAGQVAEQQGQSKDIKAFGARMVKDHSKAGKELQAAVKADKSGNLQVPTDMTSDQQSMLDKLKSAQGADFDKTYASMMTDAHKADLGKFQAYAKGGDDPKIKAFAKKTAAVVKMHYAMITRISSKLNKTAAR